MAKMSNKMVALCSAAIGAIYIAGYVVTDTATATQQAQQTQTQPTQQTASNLGGMSTATDSTSTSTSISTNTTTASNTPSSGQKYKDGTYTGSGSNRIGTVEVAVTVKADKITDVQITNCDTHYPESDIEGLPQQVLDRQSEDVDIVSGATKSTQDFRNAVSEALDQAQQALQG